ncbi:MAG: amidohydrolase family protein [Thermaurantimonas sp.]
MISDRILRRYILQLLIALIILPFMGHAQTGSQILIKNVRIFDGTSMELSRPVHVLIEGNIIKQISTTAIQTRKNTLVFDGKGKTLIPGLIDMHAHLVFGSMTMMELLSPDLSEEGILRKASENAEKMLLRGFTTVRDVGGPIFPLKAMIDAGKMNGPRIWPAGAVISQTGGHGDFRTPAERPRRFFGQVSRAELYGAAFIADGKDEVLTAVRENLRNGAALIKLMAGGGTSSEYDPIDVTQYTLEELKAAVEAAQDWGTYVTVHAYTPRAVKKAIEAGVKCIEHGQMLDEETLLLVKENDVWLSLQVLPENSPAMSPSRLEKRKPVLEGQPNVWTKAKELGIKIAWGTDFLFEPALNARQNEFILYLKKWFTSAEILKMITHDNAQLLNLSGLRSPYKGELGVIKEGALADVILIDGDPIKSLELVASPDQNFLLIIKDGKIYKNVIK